MAYTNEQWDNFMALLNEQAEIAPDPDDVTKGGLGKEIETAEEFIFMLRQEEVIRPNLINAGRQQAREFKKLERDKAETEKAAVDIQNAIDNHPGNPSPPRGGGNNPNPSRGNNP